MSAGTQGRLVAGVVFTSAFLLFTIELLVGKAALPRFGGTSAVWTTSLFFFQAALLAGYGYAHLLASRLRPRAQGLVHALAAGVAGSVLVGQAVAWGAPFLPTGSGPGDIGPGQVVAFLSAACGAPFVLLATTGPLLQHWYAGATRGAPWRFYAVSNAGSLLALVVYPFVLEPRLGLRLQAQAVGVVFLAWVAALGLAAWRLLRAAQGPLHTLLAASPAPDPGGPATAPDAKAAKVAKAAKATRAGKAATRIGAEEVAPRRTSAREAATWVGLSALGTLFLSAVNNVMCQDVAPTPLLWALPLGLYLLSFIVTFSGDAGWTRRGFVLLWVAGLASLLAHTVLMPEVSLLFTVATYSVVQLAANLLCHAELYRRRPPVERLSTYYLWMAVGGVLGSLAVGFVAPLVFRDYSEFSVGLVLVSGGVAWALVRVPTGQRIPFGQAMGALASVFLLVFTFFLDAHLIEGVVETRRNFFGVLRVQEEGTRGEVDHVLGLRHGNILHGVQWTHPSRVREPTTYYTRGTGLYGAIEAARARAGGHVDVEVLGLGLGSIAALLDKGDTVDFIEVNPDVIALAEGEGGHFSVLQRSDATVTTHLGDARQALQQRRAAGAPLKDLVVVDVFSGDAVPAHLFTVESFELFFQRLEPHGLLAVHVSNRHLRLGRVAFGIAALKGWPVALYVSRQEGFATAATWVVLARDGADLPRLETGGLLREVLRQVDEPLVWTDDFQSVLHVLRTD